MTRLTARSSTIFIAIGEDTRVYRSVSEIPPELRRKLQESTQSMNSATILIADKRGREELLRALAQRSQDEEASSLTESLGPPQTAPPAASTPPPARPRFSWRRWLEVLLPAALGASLWFFIDSHF
jgi:hypothetical protein